MIARRNDDSATRAFFPETNWSLVLSARTELSAEGNDALNRLCAAYWYPVYAFLRRKGNSPHEAEELTQGFFAHVLRAKWLAKVGPEKGRFRTFVLRCLINFVSTEKSRRKVVTIDFSEAEERYLSEPGKGLAPDLLFEKQWAAAVLEQARQRTRMNYENGLKLERFEKLWPFLVTEECDSQKTADHLGLSQDAFRQELSRLRKAFREAIREELARTVAGPEEIDEEWRHLRSVFER